jgi:hypothetical protein
MPEFFGSISKYRARLLLAAFICPARYLTAIREMYHHRWIRTASRPMFYSRCTRDFIHRAAWVKSTRQGGSCIEAISLVVKGSSAPTRINVGFQNRNIYTTAGQYGCSSQASNPGANYNNLLH